LADSDRASSQPGRQGGLRPFVRAWGPYHHRRPGRV